MPSIDSDRSYIIFELSFQQCFQSIFSFNFFRFIITDETNQSTKLCKPVLHRLTFLYSVQHLPLELFFDIFIIYSLYFISVSPHKESSYLWHKRLVEWSDDNTNFRALLSLFVEFLCQACDISWQNFFILSQLRHSFSLAAHESFGTGFLLSHITCTVSIFDNCIFRMKYENNGTKSHFAISLHFYFIFQSIFMCIQCINKST